MYCVRLSLPLSPKPRITYYGRTNFVAHHGRRSSWVDIKHYGHLGAVRRGYSILLRITGEDRPGLTSSIMDILAQYDVDIQDIGQADIHSTLSLGILIRVAEDKSGHVMKDLLFKASELGVNIGFAPVTMDEYEAWVGRQGKNRYILTVLGRRIRAREIEAVSRHCMGHC